MTREEARTELTKVMVGETRLTPQIGLAIALAIEGLRTAHWKRFHIYMYGTYFECDNCGFEAPNNYNYCPNCGAKMEGVYREQ